MRSVWQVIISEIRRLPTRGQNCLSWRKLILFAPVCKFKQKDPVHNVGHKTSEATDTTESETDESIFKIEEISTVKTTGKQLFVTVRIG